MNYEELYEQYANEVFRFLLKLTRDTYLAEEFTQECFLKAYKNIEKYNSNCKFSVWLCQIAKNSYYDYCRKNKNLPLDENTIDQYRMEDAFCKQETTAEIHKILHSLEEPYKEVFTLKVFGELSYKDISELFGKSENWSRVVFFRAKTKIIEKLSME